MPDIRIDQSQCLLTEPISTMKECKRGHSVLPMCICSKRKGDMNDVSLASLFH